MFSIMRPVKETPVFVLSCLVIILVQIADRTDALPSRKRTTKDSSSSGSGRLSVTVVRTAVEEFLKRNSNPEREIEGVERTSLSVRTSSTTKKEQEQTHSREPTWFSKQGGSGSASSSANFSKKMKRRNRRKRQKRGAKVNTDATLISEFPTHARLYKYCNKLGFCLRLNTDGTVDGTHHKEDSFSKLFKISNS